MQTIFLTPYDNSLTGKYKSGDDVSVVLYTESSGFTVTLPDADSSENTRFTLSVVGVYDGTVKAITGQYIGETNSIVLKNNWRLTVKSYNGKYYIDNYDNSSTQIMFTPEGGIAHRYINDTGGDSVKGTVVHITGDNTVGKIVVDVPDPIAVIYEDGIANGAEMWVVTEGKAECLVIGTCTAGQLARGFVTGDSGYISGYLLCESVPTSPFATDKHFYEFGHVNTGRTGAGLAMVQIHKN